MGRYRFREWYVRKLEEATLDKNAILNSKKLKVGGSKASSEFAKIFNVVTGETLVSGESVVLLGIISKKEEYIMGEVAGDSITISSNGPSDLRNKSFKIVDIKFKKGGSTVFIKVSRLDVVYRIETTIENAGSIFINARARGSGGVKFEKTFGGSVQAVINNFGAISNDIPHFASVSKFMEIIDSNVGPREKWCFPENCSVTFDGKANKKRNLGFNGSGIEVDSKGSTLRDLTLTVNGRPFYVSLKMGEGYYLLSGSVREIIEKGKPEMRFAFYDYLGFDPQKLENDWASLGFEPQGYDPNGFPPSLLKSRKNHDLVANLEEIIQKALSDSSEDYIIVNEINSTNAFVQEASKVTVGAISGIQHLYPGEGKGRSYCSVKFKAEIGGATYKVDIQFRGTTPGEKKPSYLRLHLDK